MREQKIIIFLFFIFYLSIAVAAKPKVITVVLDWFPNPNHAPLFVAEQEGFFTEQGLKVRFISPADSMQGEKMVAAGKTDIAVTYHPSLLLHVSQGLPLVRIATLVDQPLGCLILRDRVVTTSSVGADFCLRRDGKSKKKMLGLGVLAGKKIGYASTEIEEIILSAMLKTAGLSLNQVQLINVGFNLMPAFLSKRIDGFIGGMRNFEPLAVKEQGVIPQILYPEDFGFPQYEELILVAKKSKDNDPRFKRFIIALFNGVKYLKKNPDKSWQKFIKKHPELNNELNKKSWFVTIQYFADDPAKLNKALYKNFADFIYKEKLISFSPSLNDYAMEF